MTSQAESLAVGLDDINTLIDNDSSHNTATTSIYLDQDSADNLAQSSFFDKINLHPSVFNLFIVAFNLPIKLIASDQKCYEIEKIETPVVSELYAIRHQLPAVVKFVGWPGIILKNAAEEHEIEKLLEPLDCIPVFLSAANLKGFSSFIHDFMIPMFHGVFTLIFEEVFDGLPSGWAAYQNVNQSFAKILTKQAEETDSIWTHDFHLLLVPQYVSRRIHRINCGLYIHSPFPSYELFGCFPNREEILRGMLFADMVGFDFSEHAKNFMVCVKRLLGIEHHFRTGGFLQLHHDGRDVLIKISHATIDFLGMKKFIQEQSEIKVKAANIREAYQDKFIIVSVDQLQYCSGLVPKVQCIQKFLSKFNTSKVIFIQFLTPTWYMGKQDEKYKLEFENAVKELNMSYDTNIVELKFTSLSLEEKLAYFIASNAYMSSCFNSALNLDAMKYICCKSDVSTPMIVPKFSKINRVLKSVIPVNIFNREQVSEALQYTVQYENQLKELYDRDIDYLRNNSLLGWTQEVIQDLLQARKREDLVYVSCGFGNSYRYMGLDTNFQKLDLDTVVLTYRKATNRVFFLDHEGTLAQDRRMITAVPGIELLSALGSAPSSQITRCLEALHNAGDTVIILSGRDRFLLSSWFSELEDKIGLCAEHGFFYKVPKLYGDHWKTLTSTTDFTWKVIASQLMHEYGKRTQGAIIENKGSALVFQYRDADNDFGVWQAKELSTNLKELLQEYPVTVMEGKGYVEVKLTGVSKGIAVMALLKGLDQIKPIDFILCVGDDRSDEEMFPVVNSFFSSSCLQKSVSLKDIKIPSSNHAQLNPKLSLCGPQKYPTSPDHRGRKTVSTSMKKSDRTSMNEYIQCPSAFSVTVGKKPSEARYYLNDVDDVLFLLESLTFLKLGSLT